jgi:uncharacterized protein (TIGR02266 family)
MVKSSNDEFDIDLDELGPRDSDERRRTPREPIKLGVRFGTAQDLAKALRASTLNIGMGGLCLLTRRPYAAGTELKLTIELGHGDVLQVTAVVAWARPGRAIGVRFLELEDAQRDRLARLLGKPPKSSAEGQDGGSGPLDDMEL